MRANPELDSRRAGSDEPTAASRAWALSSPAMLHLCINVENNKQRGSHFGEFTHMKTIVNVRTNLCCTAGLSKLR